MLRRKCLADSWAFAGPFSRGRILIQVLLYPTSQGTAASAIATGQGAKVARLP